MSIILKHWPWEPSKWAGESFLRLALDFTVSELVQAGLGRGRGCNGGQWQCGQMGRDQPAMQGGQIFHAITSSHSSFPPVPTGARAEAALWPGLRSALGRVQRSTCLLSCHRLWGHPWTVLRPGRAVQNWRPSAGYQLHLHGRLCGPRLLQPGNLDQVDGAEGKMAGQDDFASWQPRVQTDHPGFSILHIILISSFSPQVYGFYDECQNKYGNCNAWRYCCKVMSFSFPQHRISRILPVSGVWLTDSCCINRRTSSLRAWWALPRYPHPGPGGPDLFWFCASFFFQISAHIFKYPKFLSTYPDI